MTTSTAHPPCWCCCHGARVLSAGMGASLLFYLAVSIMGYLALGDAVPGDILTGFKEPAGVVTAANVMVLLHMLPAYQVSPCLDPRLKPLTGQGSCSAPRPFCILVSGVCCPSVPQACYPIKLTGQSHVVSSATTVKSAESHTVPVVDGGVGIDIVDSVTRGPFKANLTSSSRFLHAVRLQGVPDIHVA